MVNTMKTEDAPLTRYLATHLQPLTEADPMLLANYVVALLKNNKPKKELQKLCIDQLYDFLAEGTKDFVVNLFRALEDGTIQASHDEPEISKSIDALTVVSGGGEITEPRCSPQPEKGSSFNVNASSDHEECTDDEDDDRNHKHRRRVTRSRSFERGSQEDDERGPYRKRNRLSGNGQQLRGNEHPLSEFHQGSVPLHVERAGLVKYDRRISRDPGIIAAVRMNAEENQRRSIRGGPQFRGDGPGPRFDSQNGLSRCAPGRGRLTGGISWASHEQRYPPFDGTEFNQSILPPVPSPASIYSGRATPVRGNAPPSPWGHYGHVSGLGNGSLDQALSLNASIQGGRGVPMNAGLGVGMNTGLGMTMARPRCPDFEERGYCLRGDLCPMEHGANRIVVEDVQSLSQFNLSVTLPSGRGMGIGTGPVSGPSSVPPASSLGLVNRFVRDTNLQSLDDPGLSNGAVPINLGLEPDLYDPDQPLWNKDRPEVSVGMRRLTSFRKGQDEHDWESGVSDQQGGLSLDEGDPERLGKPGTTASGGSQEVQPGSSVWDRIGPVDRCDSRVEGCIQPSKNSAEGSHRLKLLRKEILEDQHAHGRPSGWQGKGEGEVNVVEEKVSRALDVSAPQEKGVSTGLQGDAMGSRPVEYTSHSSRGSGHRGNKGTGERAQRTLYVSCIPSNLNRRELLLTHFKKFGDVLDIRIPAHSDRAFVQFSRREDAEAALISPEAVMGNRFIRLSWANRDSVADSREGPGVETQAPPSRQKEKICSGPHAIEANANESAGKAASGNGQQSSIPPAQKKQEELEHMKEEIRRKQEELAQKRDNFRRKLDELSKQGVGMRGDSEAEQPIKMRPKLEEPELEDMSPRKPGPADTLVFLPVTEQGTSSVDLAAAGHLKTSLGESSKHLGSALASPGTIPLPSPRIARTPFPRPSGGTTGSAYIPFTWGPNRYKLDNRTTIFRILPPFPEGLSNIAAVNDHFASFGELLSVELEDGEGQKTEGSIKSMEKTVVRVTFGSRRAAEKAFVQGRWFQGASLQLMWFTPSVDHSGVTMPLGSRQVDMSRENPSLNTPKSSISGTVPMMENEACEEGKQVNESNARRSQVRLVGENFIEEVVQSANEVSGNVSHSSQAQRFATQPQPDISTKLDHADGGSYGIHSETTSVEIVR